MSPPYSDGTEYASPEFFEAPLAGGPHAARIGRSAVRDLRTALAGASADVVGLVLGAYTSRGPYIQRFEPLPLPVGNDRDWLPKTLVPFLDDSGGSPSPMGFFRVQIGAGGSSHPAGRKALPGQVDSFAPPLQVIRSGEQSLELQMTGWDFDLVRRHLPRLQLHRALFLVVQRGANRPWPAALFALDADWVPAQKAPALVFPFDEDIRTGFHNGSADDSPPATGKDPGLIIPAASQEGYRPSLNARWGILFFLIAAFLIGGGLATYKWLHPGGPASGSLALRVSRIGEDFEVSWNRSSGAVRQASFGTLTIHDGEIIRSLQLDGLQLREGKILYSPLFSELSFRLEVGASDRTREAESVQVVAWNVTPTLPPAAIAIPPTAPVSRPSISTDVAGTRLPLPAPPARSERETQSSVPSPVSRVAAPTVTEQESQKATAQGAAQTSIQMQSQGLGSAGTPANPEIRAPATVAVARNELPKAPEVQAAREIQSTPPVSTPAPQPPQAQAPWQPALLPSTNAGVAALPPTALGRLPGSNYSPPVPIEQTPPKITPNVRAALNALGHQVTVSVRLSIDASGAVKSANLVSSPQSKELNAFYIRTAALTAAGFWRFRPGTLNGRAIPSEYTIDFVFR